MKHIQISIVLSIFLLSACAPATLPISTETAVPAPNSIPSTPTRDSLVIQEFPVGGIDTAGEEQPPGQYHTPNWYLLPFTFETTEVFRGMGENAEQGQIFGIAQGNSPLPPHKLLFWLIDPHFSIEQTLTELQGTSQLHFNTQHMVSIGGISATQFDAAGAGSIPALGKLVGMSSWHLHSPQVQIRFTVLPVKDRTLVIYIEAPYDEFETFASKAEQVLSTVKFDR